MTRLMRIVHILASDVTKAGGVQTHLFFLTKELAQFGIDISVWGGGQGPPIYPYTKYKTVAKGRDLPLPNGNWSTFNRASVRLKIINNILRQEKIDLIHIHEPYNMFFNWQLLIKVGDRLPIVTTFHNAWDKGSLTRYLLEPILPLFRGNLAKHVKAAIFVSGRSRECWENVLPEQMVKRVIPNGVDTQLFHPSLTRKTQERELLYLARLVPRKGIKYLLEAALQLTQEGLDFHLTVAGSGPELTSAKNYVTANRLDGQVTFIGEVATLNEKIALYQKSYLFCAPYQDEAFAISALEAMACGVPVVGFENSAFRVLFAGYPLRETLVVESKSSRQLATAIKTLLNDTNLREDLRDWCVRESRKYNWQDIAAQTAAVYRQAL